MERTHATDLTRADVPRVRNIPVVTRDGEEIGHVGDAYYDEETERLECVGIAGDALGLTKRVVPVAGATLDEQGALHLPYSRSEIEGAPEWSDADEYDRDDAAYLGWSEYYAGFGPFVAPREPLADADAAMRRGSYEIGSEGIDLRAGRLRRSADEGA